ncbi:MAG: carbon-nitrogen hydrolase family protein [Phycisphaerales bacterium JB040]
MAAAEPVLAAILQARPRPTIEQSLDRLADLVSDAARRGARLVAVGETFLPGYPAWLDWCPGALLWDAPETKAVFAEYRRNSITIPGTHHERLRSIARDHGVVLVAGVSERVEAGPGNRTLYNTLLTYDADGRLANHHRKLVPTFTERTVWGPGDGAGLRSVDTAVGRVSALVCWEHWMPLARQALHESGEFVHVAVWPWVHERHQIASRQYAFEGRCYVLAVGQIMRTTDLPAGLARQDDAPDLLLRGGSAIIGPDAGYLTEPVLDAEDIILAELDPARLDEESMTLDVTGHYARPDVFEFGVRPGARRPEEPRDM